MGRRRQKCRLAGERAGRSGPAETRLDGRHHPLDHRFDSETGVLRLDSIHPSHSFDEIRENTGFDLGVSEPAPATAPPSADGLGTLRGTVRRRMIETGTYAGWAERTLGN